MGTGHGQVLQFLLLLIHPVELVSEQALKKNRLLQGTTSKLRISYTPGLNLWEGETLVLDCEVLNLKGGEVVWSRLGFGREQLLSHGEIKLVEDARFSLSKHVALGRSISRIKISDILEEDSGLYTCQLVTEEEEGKEHSEEVKEEVVINVFERVNKHDEEEEWIESDATSATNVEEREGVEQVENIVLGEGKEEEKEKEGEKKGKEEMEERVGTGWGRKYVLENDRGGREGTSHWVALQKFQGSGDFGDRVLKENDTSNALVASTLVLKILDGNNNQSGRSLSIALTVSTPLRVIVFAVTLHHFVCQFYSADHSVIL